PGDFSPPSRFVRMTFFLKTAEPQASVDQSVVTMFHYLNNFDIPPGSSIPPAGVSEKYPDYTSWTVVSDLKKKQYHWKTFGNHPVRMIDLAQALKAAGDKMVTVEMGPQDRDTFTPSPMVEVK
ncbi:MAG: linear amide C-N hydrolase, partial [Chthoniobacterales bacterium]